MFEMVSVYLYNLKMKVKLKKIGYMIVTMDSPVWRFCPEMGSRAYAL